MVARSFLAAIPAAEWARSFGAVSLRAAVIAVRQRISGFWLLAARDMAAGFVSLGAW
jgi:hypothetical protein